MLVAINAAWLTLSPANDSVQAAFARLGSVALYNLQPLDIDLMPFIDGIDARDGSLSIIQCQFQSAEPRTLQHIRIGKNVKAARIIANDSQDPLLIESKAGERTVIELNNQ
jgi:hypothetical protein